jgi:prepilin-type processing-associated H-X9-DG protein
MSKNNHHFSLVELLVVIAIMATLISILSPSLRGMISMSERLTCLKKHKMLAMAVNMYCDDHDDFLPKKAPVSYRVQDHQNLIGLGLLYDTYIQNPMAFYCPTMDKPNISYEGPYGWKLNFTNKDDNTSINCSSQFLNKGLLEETLNGYINNHNDADSSGDPSRKALTSDFYKLGYGIAGHEQGLGYNVSYADGHAIWFEDIERRIMFATDPNLNGAYKAYSNGIWINYFSYDYPINNLKIFY